VTLAPAQDCGLDDESQERIISAESYAQRRKRYHARHSSSDDDGDDAVSYNGNHYEPSFYREPCETSFHKGFCVVKQRRLHLEACDSPHFLSGHLPQLLWARWRRYGNGEWEIVEATEFTPEQVSGLNKNFGWYYRTYLSPFLAGQPPSPCGCGRRGIV